MTDQRRHGRPGRRTILRGLAAGLGLGAAGMAGATLGAGGPARAATPLARAIPSSGEPVPAVGLGSWITFNVGDDPRARESCAGVMRAFLDAGGTVIDSSPMYGSAQDVIGWGLAHIGATGRAFAADKVWTSGDGAGQIAQSQARWRRARLDLLQVHNLLDWESHLPLLQAMKADGRLRYLGITTSEGRRHREFEQVMRTQRLDAVQLTYNPLDRAAEARLLPLAQERGMAVLVNRPFRQGALTRRLAGAPLPGFAAELGAASWAQLILAFILAHPAVTCVIPATSRADHARENVAAAALPLPDADLRRRIVAAVEASA